MKVEAKFLFRCKKKKSVDCDLENKREKVLTDWHSIMQSRIVDFLGQ